MPKFMRLWVAGLVALACLITSADAATLLYRKKGEQFLDASGNPLAGGKLFFYQATTTTPQTTFSDSAGVTPNANPLVLDSAGRLTSPVYFGDSDSFSAYKETLTNSVTVTVSPWPFDNIPAAVPAETAAAFAPPLLSWTQVTNAASPVVLTAGDAGKAYEADTTSGNIEFDLPSASSVGDGKGFLFKKTAAGNSMIIDPSGSETIDNVSTSLTITGQNTVVGIFSNGAEWYRIEGYLDAVVLAPLLPGFKGVQAFTASGTYTPSAGTQRVLVIVSGSSGGGGGSDNDASANAGIPGGGGGAGETAIGVFTAAQIGASQAVTIGVAGTAGAAANGTTGGNGSASSLGALLSANGGAGGVGSGLTTASTGTTAGGDGGTGGTGGTQIRGGPGGTGFSAGGGVNVSHGISGPGGVSFWGGGARAVYATNAENTTGITALVPGSGGSGGSSKQSATGAAGGVGAPGFMLILEFGS